MLDTYIKNRGMTKTIIHKNNHNTINETNWDADYDGSVANVSLDFAKNGRNEHLNFKLTNDDLANMLSIPSVSQPIHKRLKNDFAKKNFAKQPESLKQIFLELDNESSSDSDSDSLFDSDSDSGLPLKHIDTPFYNDVLNNSETSTSSSNSNSSPIQIQELLTHVSSPLPNEEFIMPFTPNSLESFKPVIKIVHSKTKSSSNKKSSKHSSKNSHKQKSKRNSRRVRHHNYPSTRKSPRRRTSRRS